MLISYPINEDASFGVDVHFVVLDAEAEDQSYAGLMPTQGIKLISRMSPIQIYPSFMQIWHDQYFSWFQVHVVPDDVG